MLCTYSAKKVSTIADLHALLEAAGRINYHVNVLQKTKFRKTDMRQSSDGILIIRGEEVPSRNIGRVGFVVHLSVDHLDSHEILSPRLAILRLPSASENPHYHHSPKSAVDDSELDAFYKYLEEIIRNENLFCKFIVGVCKNRDARGA
ncbi:unnamed protein product [Strongylus vulgaris]|uniref:Uncharacterized protein n=1 Tax=Strongylus vulgaris TaxID=40348 RepID=A0A3P7IKB3_STRVU|nr:unnamed protein product [Strongylus vulgaris]